MNPNCWKQKKLGVVGVYNYKNDSWTKEALEESGGFDLIIDSAMGQTLDSLVNVCAPGGRIVFYGATLGNPEGFNARKVFWNQIKLIGSTMGSDKDFINMLRYVEDHKIKPIIDEIYDLENAVDAFDKMKSGDQLGKLVIQIS